MLDCKFRRQYVIGSYVVDFACVERRLVIELDGGQHADQLAQDARRSAFLGAQGFHVMRFWNDDVVARFDEVLATIHAHLETGPSP